MTSLSYFKKKKNACLNVPLHRQPSVSVPMPGPAPATIQVTVPAKLQVLPSTRIGTIATGTGSCELKSLRMLQENNPGGSERGACLELYWKQGSAQSTT